MSSCRACTYLTGEHVSICPNCGSTIEDEILQKPTPEMILMRKRLENFIWSLGVIFPTAVSLILRGYGFHFYVEIVLPSLPFICLALICRISTKISSQSVVGALISALILYFLLFYLYL